MSTNYSEARFPIISEKGLYVSNREVCTYTIKDEKMKNKIRDLRTYTYMDKSWSDPESLTLEKIATYSALYSFLIKTHLRNEKKRVNNRLYDLLYDGYLLIYALPSFLTENKIRPLLIETLQQYLGIRYLTKKQFGLSGNVVGSAAADIWVSRLDIAKAFNVNIGDVTEDFSLKSIYSLDNVYMFDIDSEFEAKMAARERELQILREEILKGTFTKEEVRKLDKKLIRSLNLPLDYFKEG